MIINKENKGAEFEEFFYMKLEQKDIEQIKRQFGTMKTKEDLLALLNFVKYIVHGEKTILFKIKHLTFHSNPKANPNRYFQFNIKKKNGSARIIHAPQKGLKEIQKCLNLIFQVIYEVNPAATGFVPGKSIVDNARLHVDSLYVYNIDLKDFFPSIDQARIWGRLGYSPFNLNEKNKRLELANIIASLCCHKMEVERINEKGEWIKITKNVLPQGAPTSPVLTNIICERLDKRLSGVAKRFGLKYSRYADDITFSSMHNVYMPDEEFIQELNRIISDQNFHIKESKTRLQKKGYRQQVTGLVVNEKVNVQKNYIKQLRMWLYYWENYGYEKANINFISQYNKDGLKNGEATIKNVLAGKLDYLKMVKGEQNPLYLKLKDRFSKLTFETNSVNRLLNIWEKEGIEKAMDFYYSDKQKGA